MTMSDGFATGFRLSPQQKHLWMLQQAGDAYRARCDIQIAGRLDRARLERTARGLTARWEILRTTFRCLPGVTVPVQAIQPELPPSFTSEVREESADFDLASGPLFALRLAELGPDRHRLTLELPALCSDAAGLGRLACELAASYLNGASVAPGEEEPMQYADLAEWQHELLGEDEGTAFWRRQDLSACDAVDLPGSVSGAPFAPCALQLPGLAELEEATAGLAARCGVAVEAVLLAAWQALLWRSTGAAEIAVGLVCDGRRLAELRNAPGPLSRHVPVHWAAAAGETITDLAIRAAQAMSDAVRRQEYFALPEEGSNFFRFSFEAAEEPGRVEAGGVVFNIGAPRAAVDRFAVQLACIRGAGGLAGELRYDAGALPEAQAARLASRLETLLRDALNRPQAELGSLRAIGDEERQAEIQGWNETSVHYPDCRAVHRRIEEQARSRPGAAAVISAASVVTYGDLNARANRLAHYLRSLGVGPETRVGVHLERSPEVVVAVLAVLKAGGAFVPLDPDYPAQRLAWTLADSGAAALLTRGELLTWLPEVEVRTIRLDAEAAQIAASSAEEPQGDPLAGNLAYVIYTSGSTGRPKGVGVPHAALTNYLSWLDATYPIGPGDRLMLKAAFSFDVAVRELLWPLASGAGMVVAAAGGQRDAAYLARLAAEHGVTVLNFSPSMLTPFLEQPELAACTRLVRVLAGGEALPRQVRDRFFERLGEASLHNHYGPTEATITSTSWTCRRGNGSRTVPIGRPLGNVRALVLGRDLEPVPAGAPGELAVGGAGLARGYLGNPAATALAFVPDPHSRVPGERLYLTGDLARRLPDGSLEFLGRSDDQVKVRGFRIELGEIELVLREHPGVKAAAAVVREDAPGDRRLAAYVVPAGPQAGLDARGLRDWLRERLPEHMIPAAFVALDALPLSPSGKVDRRALPPPEAAREAGRRFVAPRSPVEEAVAGIWAEVMKLERVGAEDDFFTLGGHSLLAMQVVSRLQEVFRTPLPLRVLFEESTVEKLSSALVAAEPQPGQTEKIAHTLKRVRELSAEGVHHLLAERRASSGGAA